MKKLTFEEFKERVCVTPDQSVIENLQKVHGISAEEVRKFYEAAYSEAYENYINRLGSDANLD